MLSANLDRGGGLVNERSSRRYGGPVRAHRSIAGLLAVALASVAGGGCASSPDRPASSATPVDEAPVEDLKAAEGDLRTVEVIVPGRITMHAHTRAPVRVRLVNHHERSRTYGLEVIDGGGVSLLGLPKRVRLAARETRTLIGVLKAGRVTRAAYTEVDATSDRPTDQDSGTTEIRVVARPVADQP